MQRAVLAGDARSIGWMILVQSSDPISGSNWPDLVSTKLGGDSHLSGAYIEVPHSSLARNDI